MTDSSIAAPPHARERRVRARRRSDHHAQEELGFLTRCLDIVSAAGTAEERLASLLELLADTAGARRAAVLADAGERRVAVALRRNEDPTAAEALAAWLDARAPRTRAERAAAGRAVVSHAVAAPTPAPRLVRAVNDHAESDPQASTALVASEDSGAGPSHYACLSVPGSWPIVLGFEFGDEVAAENCALRLPMAFIRHAGAALAMISESLATERELELLRAQDAERTHFVSTVAHELRTPLTGLVAAAELLPPGRPAELVRDRVQAMRALTEDLLEISRLDTGSERVELDSYDLAELTARTIRASVTDTALVVAAGARLETDRRRLDRIIGNLVLNAHKHGATPVTVTVDGRTRSVTVADAGPGYPAYLLEAGPQRFRTEGMNKGHGLGLTIAVGQARALGATLSFRNRAEGGAEARLTLPASAAPGATAPPPGRDGPPAPGSAVPRAR